MRSTRSGAPSRWLPYRSPEYWAIRSELFVFQLLFGLVPLIACVIGFQSCGLAAAGRLLDPRDPIHRLAKPLDEAEERRGVIRAGGPLTGDGEVCLLIHEHKSGKNWSEDFRATIGSSLEISVEFEDGHDLQVLDGPLRVDWPNVRWEPVMIRKETERETYWRQQISIPAGGRLYEACLRAPDRVFIDACVQRPSDNVLGHDYPAFAGPCGATPPIVTPGDSTPQPRIDHLAASIAGHASLLGGAVLLLLLYLWRVLGARPFVAAMLKRLRSAPSTTLGKPALWVIGLAPIGLLIALGAFRIVFADAGEPRVDRWGYAFAYAVCGGALILGALASDRRRALRDLIDAIRRDLLSSIAHLKEGQRVTIEAEIDPRAPLSAAQLTGARRAYWAVSATRVYRSGKNYASRVEPERTGPSLVPIRAPGGAALLDLEGAAVDLRALRVIARKRALKRGDYLHVLGQQAPFDGAYVLEERLLDPGEAIYVSGVVRRLAAPSVEAGYREAGAIPVIGGTTGEPVVVHAGSRRSLLRGLSLEKGFLDVALGLAGVIAAATAGLIAYLVSL